MDTFRIQFETITVENDHVLQIREEDELKPEETEIDVLSLYVVILRTNGSNNRNALMSLSVLLLTCLTFLPNRIIETL
jgi:hypothetical protein